MIRMQPNRKNDEMTLHSRAPRFQGKVAIVTGAGTGQATAILFACEGANVLLADLNVANDESIPFCTHLLRPGDCPFEHPFNVHGIDAMLGAQRCSYFGL